MRILFSAALSACVLFISLNPGTAEARSSAAKEAKKICKAEMRRDHKADGFHDVTAIEKKRRVFKVVGYAERDGRRSADFNCKVKYGEITKLEFDGWRKSSDNNDAAKAALAVAAVAAVVAAAASSKGHHDDHQEYSYQHNEKYHDRPSIWYPSDGVTCYRKQRACYKVGRGYNAKWTHREFDY